LLRPYTPSITDFNRLRRDAEYFQAKLSKIDGFGDLGERLLELVDKKQIEYVEQQSAPARSPAPAEETPSKEPPKPEDEAKA
jgi:vacuolar protein sorting-associated protein 54